MNATPTPEEIAAATTILKTVAGHDATKIDMTMDEGEQAGESTDTVTHESLGVTEAQFEKYYKDGTYNWQAHAKEVEFAASQKKPDEPKQPVTEPATETTDEAKKIAEAAGLDWDSLSVKIMNDGDISAEDYAALAKIGVPESIVKEHIGLLSESADTHVQGIFDAFGGEENFQKVREWAQENYTAAQLDQLEKNLAGKDTVAAAIAELQQKTGSAGPGVITLPTTPGGQTTEGYKTEAEMIADMRKPEYRKDPAFRATVEAKVAASKWEKNPRQHVG